MSVQRRNDELVRLLTVDFVPLDSRFRVVRTAVAADYTVLVTDHLIAVTDTASARTITLPPAATAGAGRIYIVKDESGAAATNNITIEGDGAETIDGAANVTISTNYGVVRLYCTGAAWFTF